MSQRKPSTVEAIRDARGEGILPSSLGSDAQKNKTQSMFSATKEQEGPEDPREPFQKLRDSPAPAPAPTAAHPHRRLSEASRRMWARKMHEMGETEPDELLTL